MMLRLCASKEAANYRLPALIMQEAPWGPVGGGAGGGGGGGDYLQRPHHVVSYSHAHKGSCTNTTSVRLRLHVIELCSLRQRSQAGAALRLFCSLRLLALSLILSCFSSRMII